MKTMQVPAPVRFVTFEGKPMRNDGSLAETAEEQAVGTFKEFIHGRMSDINSCRGKKGMNLVLFIVGLKQHLDGQDFKVGGTIRVEDEEGRGIKESCDRAELPPLVMWNLKPHFDAVEEMKGEKDSETEAKEK